VVRETANTYRACAIDTGAAETATGSTRWSGAAALLRQRRLGATDHEVDNKQHQWPPHLLAQLRDNFSTAENSGDGALGFRRLGAGGA
jgi:hypothetical protein